MWISPWSFLLALGAITAVSVACSPWRWRGDMRRLRAEKVEKVEVPGAGWFFVVQLRADCGPIFPGRLKELQRQSMHFSLRSKIIKKPEHRRPHACAQDPRKIYCRVYGLHPHAGNDGLSYHHCENDTWGSACGQKGSPLLTLSITSTDPARDPLTGEMTFCNEKYIHRLWIELAGFNPNMGTFEASQVVFVVKNLPANAGRCKRREFDPWVQKIPWRRAQQPTPVFLPGESHGQRSLVGYGPQGRKELDTTEAT